MAVDRGRSPTAGRPRATKCPLRSFCCGTLDPAEGRCAAVVAWLIETLFVLVFIRALAGYLVRRDALQRDVTLVFTAMAVLFLTAVLRAFIGTIPALVNTMASAVLLAQPYLTLRLAAQLRRVPRWLLALALVGWVASVAVLVPYGGGVPGWGRPRGRGVVVSAQPRAA